MLVCLVLLLFIVIPHSQGEEICGSSLGTIENSETVALVVGLLVMFILVIYARSVILPFTSFFPTKIFVMFSVGHILNIKTRKNFKCVISVSNNGESLSPKPHLFETAF